MTEDYQGPTPPPELLKQWVIDILNERDYVDHVLDCAWRDGFRAARRPKPPSLAEEALTLLDDASTRLDAAHENTIRRALERLQELECGNG